VCKNIPTVLCVIISSAYIRQNNNFREDKFSQRFGAGIITNVVSWFFKFMSNLGASDLCIKKYAIYESWLKYFSVHWIGNKCDKINYWIGIVLLLAVIYCNGSVLGAHVSLRWKSTSNAHFLKKVAPLIGFWKMNASSI